MRINFILTLVFLSILSACGVPPSRTYDGQAHNVSKLNDHAVNIDLIKPVSVEVEASRNWQNTGVFLENGDKVNVNASGSWSPAPGLLAWSGPEGNILWSVEVPGIPGGALMAKLGHAGHPFEIGTTRTFQARDYGMLYFAMNDPFRYLFDNVGTVMAEIRVEGSAATPASNGKLEIVSYQYDDATGNGKLAAHIGDDAFKTRQRMITKIGEIASTKNIAIKAGSAPVNGGNYELRNESSRDGIMVLDFKMLW